MRRRTPPTRLTEAFREAGLALFHDDGAYNGSGRPLALYDGGPACWLKQFDPYDRACSGNLEVFHFIGRQRIRNVLRGLFVTDVLADGAIHPFDVDDLVEQAEWDARNAGPGCTGHHRRLDSHATPELKIPALAVPAGPRQFVLDWGLESEAERKFDGAGEATWLSGEEAQVG